jgi:hypothetical protein
MKINHQIVVFDAADLAAESGFWSGVLGGNVDAEDDWHMILVDGKPKIAVQLAPDHRQPQWPDGVPQQIHMDLWVQDFAEAHEQVMALGARVLQSVDELEPDRPDAFQVYADPAGHPFCLCFDRKNQSS